MSKFYAVRFGRKPGVYTSWPQCQEQTKGFSGAIFKSFSTKKEAEDFVNPSEKVVPVNKEKEVHIYTDGSHKRSKNFLGIGAWCRFQDQEFSLSKTCSRELLLTYDIDILKTPVSSPTAEFVAVAEVLKRVCNQDKNVSSDVLLVFHCDYVGPSRWIDGSWKAKEVYIQKIRDACLERIKSMKCKIKIVHVPGHSNNLGNDKADKLAGDETECDDFDGLMKLLLEV